MTRRFLTCGHRPDRFIRQRGGLAGWCFRCQRGARLVWFPRFWRRHPPVNR